ncbi:hypothetical protein BV25DRAFT_1791166 [Artomyces pyxidatus]|uniref:Uncharacterized protein n=1 Tax=Artomyces pyxidatus TaxID=48021 RepID=A0ACB8TKH8_9AGAM|nr:hypothetical protein BV25DRAFT_1791166 [Artomyces pyxidatus]
MHARRRSLSQSSANVPYESLPNAPMPEMHSPTLPELDTELDIESINNVEAEIIAAAPVDSRIRWIHFMLGCAVLLPWNVMITATPYFLSRLKGSSIHSTFGSYLATSFTLSNFLFLAHATATSKKAPSALRVRWSMLVLASLTLLLTLGTFVHLPAGPFAAFVLLVGIAQAGAGSYLQTSVVAVASLFGPSVMQAVMSGQAAVAIVLSSIQVLSAAQSLRTSNIATFEIDGAAEEKSARVFFGLSTLFLIVCAGGNVWLTRMPAYKAVVAPIDESWTRRMSGDFGDRRPLMAASPILSVSDTKNHIWDIARRNLVYEIAVAYVFVVTLSVFPALTISIFPVNESFHPLFFSSIHFLVFSTGDWFGRYLCSFPRLLIWSAKRLLAFSLARTLFIPLFLACNFQRDRTLPYSPPLINSDVLFMLILFWFGLSNGYVSSMCMMSAPSLEHNPRLLGRKEDVDIAAPVASFCLVGGLVIGSMMSFGVGAAVCRCNPFTYTDF